MIVIVAAGLVLLGQAMQGAFTLIIGAVLLAVTALDKRDLAQHLWPLERQANPFDTTILRPSST
jgi:hypothetical protein